MTGTVESISAITGQVILREPPLPVQVRAYVDGTVVQVNEGEGVVEHVGATGGESPASGKPTIASSGAGGATLPSMAAGRTPA